ncbi:MAG: helix-turn-helix domain-containing protein [Candidatus Omnitrophica bacterium]|nr:helix-turn-helix domain-containing protein [Candidatus Omnitrophota bacterium]MCK5288819.1 helix-turn-helix domain-containing protein [Candidatus Omnitrophota bacterium]MCK5493124.1 helix-turn-helix domain-containing protein [Candidatus Omnitrophota bacterium]
MEEKLIATREVSRILGISEKEVIEMAETKLIPHFKVAGEFLRFKREDILKVKPEIKKRYNLPEKKIPYIEGLREFIYFNDFYIFSIAIIVILIWVIIKDFLGTI